MCGGLRQAHHAHHASQTPKYEQMLRELASAGGKLECALAAAQQMQASAQGHLSQRSSRERWR